MMRIAFFLVSFSCLVNNIYGQNYIPIPIGQTATLTGTRFDPSRVGNQLVLSANHLSIQAHLGNSGCAINKTVDSGQYKYAEFTITAVGPTDINFGILASNYTTDLNSGLTIGSRITGWGYVSGTSLNGRTHNNITTSYGVTCTTGDIIGIYADDVYGAVYISKNNTVMNDGDPLSGALKTGAMYSVLPGLTYFVAADVWAGGIIVFNQTPIYTPTAPYTPL